VKYPLLALIRIYQWTMSPLLGPVCRFYPSCSRYAFEAIATHGTIYGSYLAIRRLLRCHPWNPGGLDPVPPRSERPRWAPPLLRRDTATGPTRPYRPDAAESRAPATAMTPPLGDPR